MIHINNPFRRTFLFPVMPDIVSTVTVKCLKLGRYLSCVFYDFSPKFFFLSRDIYYAKYYGKGEGEWPAGVKIKIRS